ncbi:KLTH0A06006p [Lachancea thermotolerans CBS 6340]|uniref:KLTH0A06006p n=1 Tax=Lachancea thermotolerans (strain ATCC 56472 / CBS 6340 / NRRL Y-8284) TaxID=559295 RepID=C5DBX1_LACTC|nr:KLTH0A06006p [Lachancea thermotolerans CBS 6340]CAR21278.1 KLTH0A06006p [Lachancea thermotolerans CBS 6340]
MIKIRAFTKKLSGGFDSPKAHKKRSVSEYDKKHESSRSARSSMRRRAISSTQNIKTELPPLPTQEYTLSTASTASQDDTLGSPARASRSGKHYIYDQEAYKKASSALAKPDPNYSILNKKNGINPTSAKDVMHYLVLHFKHTLIQQTTGESDKKMDSIKAAMEIFRPNLSHYVSHEVGETIHILESFFPLDGCSLTGDALKKEINEQIGTSKHKLILALRIIWSKLPLGVVPWESYLKFCTVESKQNFSKMCFENFLPQVLPDNDYKCCAFDFMDVLVSIISMVDLVVDKAAQMDLLFTAGQVCFVKTPELLNYIDHKDSENADCITLAKLYRARGEALYRLFVSYLNSLAEEGKIKNFYLIDNFRIDEYPPKPYRPVTQRALTLTIPQLWDPEENNFNELIRVAAKTQIRTYSSNHPFSKLENSFLDKFEENPYKIVSTLFSRSSKRYLYKFDPHFDAEYFKPLSKKYGTPSTLGPGDQQAVATWINSCKERGFNDFLSVLDDNNHGEGTLALGFSFPKVSQEESESLPPVRVSKVEISECFISSWKYETFLAKVHNTLVIKLTKRIGDCEWLVIAMDERVGNFGYVAPSKPNESAKERDWSTLSTPPLPSKNPASYHSASDSMSSVKTRPPPPSLLGEPSSSPLLDSATGVFSDRSSVRLSSRPTSDLTSVYSNVRHHTKNNSSFDQRKFSAFDVHESPLQHSSPRLSSQSEHVTKVGSHSSKVSSRVISVSSPLSEVRDDEETQPLRTEKKEATETPSVQHKSHSNKNDANESQLQQPKTGAEAAAKPEISRGLESPLKLDRVPASQGTAKVENSARVEEPLKSEQTEKVGQHAEAEKCAEAKTPVNAENPVKVEEPLKAEESLKFEKPEETEEPEKTEKPEKTGEALKANKPLKTEEPLKAEEPVKAKEVVENEEPVKATGDEKFVKAEEPSKLEKPYEVGRSAEINESVKTEEQPKIEEHAKAEEPVRGEELLKAKEFSKVKQLAQLDDEPKVETTIKSNDINENTVPLCGQSPTEKEETVQSSSPDENVEAKNALAESAANRTLHAEENYSLSKNGKNLTQLRLSKGSTDSDSSGETSSDQEISSLESAVEVPEVHGQKPGFGHSSETLTIGDNLAKNERKQKGLSESTQTTIDWAQQSEPSDSAKKPESESKADSKAEVTLQSPLAIKLKYEDSSLSVSTPVNALPPNGLPQLPMKVQNPSVASFADATVKPDSAESTMDTSETTQVQEEPKAKAKAATKNPEPYSGSIQKRNSRVVEELRKSKILSNDVLTEDLLSDLLENYDTLSTEPINSENGPTVFERVRVYFERQAANAEEAFSGSTDGDSPATRESHTESLNSKNGTWFSCNVTPPNRSGKRVKNPKNLQLHGTERAAGGPDGSGALSRTPSVAGRGLEKNGVWLELEDHPSSPAEMSSPTQAMFRHMMMKTKRSLRSLKKSSDAA